MKIRIYTVLLIVGIVVLNSCFSPKVTTYQPIRLYPIEIPKDIPKKNIPYRKIQPGLYSLFTQFFNDNKSKSLYKSEIFENWWGVPYTTKDSLDYNWFNDTIIIMDKCYLEGWYKGRIWSTQDFVTTDNDDQFVHRSIYLIKQDSLYQLLLQWNKSEFKKKYTYPDDYIVHDGFSAFISRLILKENGIVSIDSMFIAKPNFY